MVNVISFSVWGNSTVYSYGLLDNCLMIRELMPTFECWVYYNNSLAKEIRDKLESLKNVKMIKMNDTNDKRNTMWRFLPAFDPKVNICLVRDADSRIELKEIKAIVDWLKSGKDFHIMRNHPMHKRKILAGMWGCRNKVLIPLKQKYDEYIKIPYKQNNWIVDETFLVKFIYPYVVNRSYINISHNKYERHGKPFDNSLKNKYGGYIGAPCYKMNWVKKYYPGMIIPRIFKRRNG